jgi:flagellar hook-length control protein FliK
MTTTLDALSPAPPNRPRETTGAPAAGPGNGPDFASLLGAAERPARPDTARAPEARAEDRASGGKKDETEGDEDTAQNGAAATVDPQARLLAQRRALAQAQARMRAAAGGAERSDSKASTPDGRAPAGLEGGDAPAKGGSASRSGASKSAAAGGPVETDPGAAPTPSPTGPGPAEPKAGALQAQAGQIGPDGPPPAATEAAANADPARAARNDVHGTHTTLGGRSAERTAPGAASWRAEDAGATAAGALPPGREPLDAAGAGARTAALGTDAAALTDGTAALHAGAQAGATPAGTARSGPRPDGLAAARARTATAAETTAVGEAAPITPTAMAIALERPDALRGLSERLRGTPTERIADASAQAAASAPGMFAAELAALEAPIERPGVPGFPITVPLHDPRFGQAFGERITWLIREGLQAAELTLNPAELGPIRIALSLEGDAASLGVVAMHAETRSAIEQSLPRLRELLADQGLQLGGATVDGGAGRQGRRDEDSARPAGARGGRDRITGTASAASLDPALAATRSRSTPAGRIDLFA